MCSARRNPFTLLPVYLPARWRLNYNCAAIKPKLAFHHSALSIDTTPASTAFLVIRLSAFLRSRIGPSCALKLPSPPATAHSQNHRYRWPGLSAGHDPRQISPRYRPGINCSLIGYITAVALGVTLFPEASHYFRQRSLGSVRTPSKPSGIGDPLWFRNQSCQRHLTATQPSGDADRLT